MKNNFWRVCCAALVLVMVAGTAFPAGMNLAGVGAKALMMSGAFRAISDDWSAMYWNPAGLAGQGNSVALEAKTLVPVTWCTPNSPSTTPGYDGYYVYRNGVEQSSESALYPAGAFGLTYQFNDRVTAGFSVFAPSALGATWDDFFTGPYEGYGNSEFPTENWFSDLKVIDIHPTVGWKCKFVDNLKLGLGLSIKYATVELQSPVISPSVNPSTGAPLPMPAHHFFVDGILTGSGVGFGFNVGALYDITEDWHVGLSYNGPTTITLDGEVEQTLYMPRIAGGGTTQVKPDAEADFNMPMDFGFGIAYDVNDKFTVAADLYWVNWESMDKIDIKMDGTGLDGQPAEDSELLLEWENTIRYNLGMNYVVNPEKGFEVRLGYYFDPTPIPDETLRPTITDVANKSNISIGFAYNLMENLVLEGYWEHLFSGEKTAAAYDNDGDGYFDNVPGDWKMQVDTFGFQFTYKF